MIKKFNSFIKENNNQINSIDNITNSLENLLLQEKELVLSLNDILLDSGIILELNSGKVLEKLTSEEDWKEYDDVNEFKELTGASLENEYQGNKSDELLLLLNSFDNNLDIKNAYFEGTPSRILEILLNKNKLKL
jgi:hypothetical protein